MSMKHEYTIWLYRPLDNTITLRHKSCWHMREHIDAERIDEFMPLTEETQQALSMLYPNLSIDDLNRAIISWENLIYKGDKFAYRLVYLWSRRTGEWV